MNLDVAFVGGFAAIDIALNVVRIHCVLREANGIFNHFSAAAVVFGHDEV